MARILTDTLDFFPQSGVKEGLTKDTENQRSGAACGRCATGEKSVLQYALEADTGTDHFARIAIRLNELPASTTAFFALDDSTGRMLEMSVTSAGRVRMWCPIAAGRPPEQTEYFIEAGVWSVIEVFWRVNAAGEGEAGWRADGSSIAKPAAIALRNIGASVAYVGAVSSTAATIYIDDFAINTGAGEWPGTVADSFDAPGCMWGALPAGDHYNPEWDKAPFQAETWDEFEANAGRKMGYVHYGDPWLTWDGFGAGSADAVHARGETVLKSIGSGGPSLAEALEGKHDAAIDAWATAAAAYGHRVLLRLWWEMNGTWFSWGRDAKYVDAWRYLHDRISAIASNVEFIWCPNTIWEDPESDPEPYYPGDAYVDHVGIDGYTGENPAKSFGWDSPHELFLPTYQRLGEIAPSKPIIICETACSEFAPAGKSKDGWIADLLGNAIPYSMPNVKGLVWFNWEIEEGEPAGSKLDWPIETSEAATAAFSEGVASAYYQPAAPTVETVPATGLLPTKATLNGTVNPNGLPTDRHFEYWRRNFLGTDWPTRTNLVTNPNFGGEALTGYTKGTGVTISFEKYAGAYHCMKVVTDGASADQGISLSPDPTVESNGTYVFVPLVVAGPGVKLACRLWATNGTAGNTQEILEGLGAAAIAAQAVQRTMSATTTQADCRISTGAGVSLATTFRVFGVMLTKATKAELEAEHGSDKRNWFFPLRAPLDGVGILADSRGKLSTGRAVWTGAENASTSEFAKGAYAPTSKEGDAGEGSEAVAVSEQVKGLKHKARYSFRLVAKNDA